MQDDPSEHIGEIDTLVSHAADGLPMSKRALYHLVHSSAVAPERLTFTFLRRFRALHGGDLGEVAKSLQVLGQWPGAVHERLWGAVAGTIRACGTSAAVEQGAYLALTREGADGWRLAAEIMRSPIPQLGNSVRASIAEIAGSLAYGQEDRVQHLLSLADDASLSDAQRCDALWALDKSGMASTVVRGLIELLSDRTTPEAVAKQTLITLAAHAPKGALSLALRIAGKRNDASAMEAAKISDRLGATPLND